ncbi:hypothetical protein [Ruminiclostridium josui]|uniref:hypothetical protein n=1 Tax=Ruminiclostridium josui TaxID=1499 RepID=UPI0004669FE5|nr:hypothetical protein [Ruminiclostridium josui]
MKNIVETAMNEINGMTKEMGLKTSTLRKASAKIYHYLGDKKINTVFNLCEQLGYKYGSNENPMI